MATAQRFSGLFSSSDILASRAQDVLAASGRANDPRFADAIVGSFTENGITYNVQGDGSIQGFIETPTGAYLAAGFTPEGQQATEELSTQFEQTSTDRLLGTLANAAIAAGTAAGLGPAGVGFLSTPAAAAVGAGTTSFANSGDLAQALRAAALGGATAFGIESLLGSAGSLGDISSALDLTLADDISQLASAGLGQDQIANIISNSYGIDPFTAASAVSSNLGTGAATGVGAGAGAEGVAGQTVNVLGDITGTGLGTVGTGLLGSVIGTGLTGAGTGADTGTQTVNVTGTGDGTGAGTGSIVGSTVGAGLGTGADTGTGQTITVTGQGTGAGTGTGSTIGAGTGSLVGTGAGTGAGTGQSIVITGTGTGTGSTVGAGVGSLLGTGADQTVTVTGTPETTPIVPSLVGAVIPSTTPDVTSKVEQVEVVDRRIRDTCPAPEMLVTLADGTKKPAGELKEGDFVKTQHENTLEWGIYPVVYKELIPSAKRLKIVFDRTEFIGSCDHKFFVSVDNWKKAEDLKVGDIVSGFTVKSIEEYQEGPVVFITVDDAHSYFCQDILSHNKSPILITPMPPLPPVPPEVLQPPVKPVNPTSNIDNNLLLLGLLGLAGTAFGGRGSTAAPFDQAAYDAIARGRSPVYSRGEFTPISLGGLPGIGDGMLGAYDYFGPYYGAGRFGARPQAFALPGLLGPNTGLMATPSPGASI